MNTKFLLAAVMLISVSLSSVLSEEKRRSKLQIRSSRPMKRFKPTQLSTDVSQVDEREKTFNEVTKKPSLRSKSVKEFLQKRKRQRMESTTEFNPQAEDLNRVLAKAAIIIDVNPVVETPRSKPKASKQKQELQRAFKRTARKNESSKPVSTTQRPVSRSPISRRSFFRRTRS
ncbi:uncharacterized protein LOC136026587 [Artemia franciscana]|uniref:uncharacterized protein LOC136026587 n=1 Tax=Artemia franciscana TaxID=6661 RepID=UPI0032DB6C4A